MSESNMSESKVSTSQSNISKINDIIIHPQYNVIIIGYTELALKSKQVRKRLIERFQKNIRIQFYNANIHPEKVFNDWGRLFVRISKDSMKDALNILPKILGVYYFSPAIECEISDENIISTITNKVLEFAGVLLKKDETFGVRAKIIGYPKLSSSELAGNIGYAILTAYASSLHLKVNLTKPTHWIYIEARNKNAYIYSDKLFSDWTGNPMELSEGALALTEGSISDIVSAFLLLKRACYILPVIFSDSFKKDNYIQEIVSLYEKFMQYLPIRAFYQLIWNFEPIRSQLMWLLNEINAPNLYYASKMVIIHRIGEWLIQHQKKIFESIGNAEPLETDSNLFQTLSKGRASQLKRNDQWDPIRYISMIEGNQFLSQLNCQSNASDSLNKEIFRITESSPIPIFRAAIGLDEDEIRSKFGLIDEELKEKYNQIIAYETDYSESIKDALSNINEPSLQNQDLQIWLSELKKGLKNIPNHELLRTICEKILEIHSLKEEFHPECMKFIQIRKKKLERKLSEPDIDIDTEPEIED